MSKSNVYPFPRRRPDTLAAAVTALENGEVIPGSRLVKAEHHHMSIAPYEQPAEALEATLDEHRATLLALAHRRQAFELQMILENNTAQIRLEAAAYRALLAGVPESDIYALGEDMAEALTSAMDTVAGA